jgi:hypothetical protein
VTRCPWGGHVAIILFLITFVCSVFLVFLLAALITLFIIVLLGTIFVASCGPKFGAQSELTFESRDRKLRLHRDNFLFFERLSAPLSSLHKQVELVGGEKDEFFVCEGSRSVGILVRFVFDVQSKKSARDHGVGSEKNVDGIVDSSAMSDDLGVVGVEVGVKEFDIAFDCGAIRSYLPQIGA